MIKPASTTEPLLAQASPIRAPRILVVDDDAMIGAMIFRILGNEHEVTVLADGQKALDFLLSGASFDLILCDLMMPRITGMEIHFALANAMPELASRILFVTGGAITPAGRKFLEGISNQRVEKPFSTSTLRAAVRSFLEKAALCPVSAA